MSNISKLVTGTLKSTLSTGTAPLSITSTTECTNLKASYAPTADALKTSSYTINFSTATAPATSLLRMAQTTTTSQMAWIRTLRGLSYGVTSTDTSVGTLNLEIEHDVYQRFSGTTSGMVVNLPGSETSSHTGITFYCVNDSTQTVTIRAHDATTVIAIPTKTAYMVVLINPGGTTNSDWIKVGSLTVT